MQIARLIRFSTMLALVATVACGDDGNSPPPPSGSFTLAVAPTSVSIVQGQTGTVTATVTRVSPFAAPVELSAESVDAGVTAAFEPSPIAASGTTSTVTISVASTVAVGDHPITIRAKGTGLIDQTVSVTVTVTAPTS